MEKSLRQTVIDWLDDNFLFGDAATMIHDDDMSFLKNGILTSLGFVRLMLYLEDTYGVSIDRKDVRPDNFDSLGKIVRYVSALPGYRGPRD